MTQTWQATLNVGWEIDVWVRLRRTTEAAQADLLAAEKGLIIALADYAGLARLRYDNGYSNFIEVLDAQRSLFDSELNAVRTQTDVIVGMINTYKAMGGGWVLLAEETANTVDFPPEEKSDSENGSTGSTKSK